MRPLAFAVIVATAMACNSGSQAPKGPATDINRNVQEINEQEARGMAAPGERGPEPLMEDLCKDVSRADTEQLEKRLKEERESGAFTVLTGEEPKILSCSRYWKKLESNAQ